MFELKIISQFAAAHQLREFHGKCERLHGHNWKIEVYVKGERLGEEGLLIDFGIIKENTKKALQELDHKFLNDLPFFTETNPSSENIARTIYNEMKSALKDAPVTLDSVEVWESPESGVEYREY